MIALFPSLVITVALCTIQLVNTNLHMSATHPLVHNKICRICICKPAIGTRGKKKKRETDKHFSNSLVGTKNKQTKKITLGKNTKHATLDHMKPREDVV